MDRDEDDRVHTEELTRVALLDQPPPPPGSKRIRRAPTIPDGYIPSQAMPASIAAQFMMNVTDELDTCTPEPVNQPRFRQPSTTEPDQFGLSRVYPDDPETPPEGPSSDQGKADDNLTSADKPYAPFKNATAFLMANWQNTGQNNKSNSELYRLFKEVLLADEFRLEDIEDLFMIRENGLLDSYSDMENLTDSWQTETVKIRVPVEGQKFRSEDAAPELEVKGLYYRPLVETIQQELSRDNAQFLQHIPYKEFWQPSDSAPPERVYGELYSSNSWLEAHEELYNLPSTPDDGIQNVLLPLMLWSDSTHLTNFGTASLWPIYMFFGGHSKYIRAKPSSRTGQHLAYIPSVRSYPYILHHYLRSMNSYPRTFKMTMSD